MVEDSKVSTDELIQKIELWNKKYLEELTGSYVQRSFKGKEKGLKITMNDRGNIWLAGGTKDGMPYLKY